MQKEEQEEGRTCDASAALVIESLQATELYEQNLRKVNELCAEACRSASPIPSLETGRSVRMMRPSGAEVRLHRAEDVAQKQRVETHEDSLSSSQVERQLLGEDLGRDQGSDGLDSSVVELSDGFLDSDRAAGHGFRMRIGREEEGRGRGRGANGVGGRS